MSSWSERPRYFTLSGFTRTERRDLCQKITSLHGEYIENAQYCTHIVCKLPGRSEKFFLGCAMGKWVLSPQYVVDSYSDGAWLEEDKYEWGPSRAHQLPPQLWPLLTAPYRWRVKVARSHTGAFSNWRVALFVKEEASKALFCRLLECGGAKVEMVALPVDGSSGTGLTHVFHDKTPGFARIRKAFRQKGTPCLPLMFIHDYLLQTGDMAPERRQSHHGFVLTGFSRKERSELSLKIETLGGVYNESKEGIQKLQRDCVHIVCKLPARTEKFLLGCAMGKWILRVEYIHDSYRMGHWLAESQYEWGPLNAPEVPPSIRWMLTAPRRCRVKNATSRRGTFHGWRVAILVKHPQSKAVFKRLLDGGGACVEELRHPAAHSKLSKVTHILHDGSMCFADMLKPYRQLGVPCLKPVYISDCLLGEQLPDLEHYRTVDGVAVWPQLSPCSLFSSQSSGSTVTSSSVTDPGLSPATLSPVRPLTSKDLNTEMTVKTTASKTRRAARPPRLPVRSVSLSGQDTQRTKQVASRGQTQRSHPSASETELVRKTRSSRKQKPLPKGQTLLGNFCQLVYSPQTDHRKVARVQTDHRKVARVLTDLNLQDRGGHITSKARCKGQKSEVKGQFRQTKVTPVVVGHVRSGTLPPGDKMGTMVDRQIQCQKTEKSEELVRIKQKVVVVGKVLTIVGKVMEKSSLKDMAIVKSSSQDTKSNLKTRDKPQDEDKLQISSPQDKAVQKTLSQDMESVQEMSDNDSERQTFGVYPMSPPGTGTHNSPTQSCMVSPTQTLVSPTQAVVSPTQAVVSHTQALVSPTQAVVSHTQAVVSHTQTLVSPTQAVVSHTQAVVSHTQTLVSPTQAVVSHTQTLVSPTQALVSHTQTLVSPTQAVVSPTQALVSPTQALVSPTQALVSPTQALVSPTQAPVSPTKALVSDVPVRMPTKRKSPCVDEAEGTMAVPRKKQKENRLPPHVSLFVKNTTQAKRKICLPFAYPTCAMFEACLDDGELFYATDIVSLSVSTSRYPPARLLHLVLSHILLPSDSAVLSHRVHQLLHTIVSQHPPTCPSMQCVYLDTVTYHDRDTARTEQFLFSLISTLLVGHLEDIHRHNYLLCLEFLVALFEKDFSVFIQHQQLDCDDNKKGGPWSSLISQVFWPAGRRGHLNVACKQLLLFFSQCLQLDTACKALLLRLLTRLVTMVAEHHRLADWAGRHPTNQTSLPHTAVMFARELAYRIQGTMPESSTHQVSAGGLCEAVGGLQPPWLSVHVCQTLLDLYDDTLLPASLQNPPLQITFSSIVRRYFYMLPRQHKPAMIDDIQSLDEESSMSQESAQAGGQQKLIDSMYRTRGSKTAARLANSSNTEGETALHVACISNNVVKVQELLRVPGIEINCQDHNGYTPLHQAALRGHVDCVLSLLKYKPTNSILSFLKCQSVDGRPNGARLDIMSKGGATVLHAAVAENQLQVAHLLLQFGGKRLLRLCNCTGQTPLRVAVSEEMRLLLLDPLSPRKTSLSTSQDSPLSQSSHESNESPRQFASTPPDGAYRDGLDSPAPVSREACQNYVYLVSRLVLSYVTLHCLCQSRHSKSQQSMDQGRITLDTSATNGDTDMEVLASLHRHVSNFQTHLRRITGGSTVEFCQLNLTALQTLAQTMK